MNASFSVPTDLHSPGPIGDVTPSTGTFQGLIGKATDGTTVFAVDNDGFYLGVPVIKFAPTYGNPTDLILLRDAANTLALRNGNNAQTFIIDKSGKLKFGITSGDPMLKASSTTLAVRLADDSADAPLTASKVTVGAGTLGAPSLAVGASDTGIFNENTGQGNIRLVSLGSESASFSAFTAVLNRETYIYNGPLHIEGSGYGITFKGGSNERLGEATLVAGTIAVANTTVTANTKVILTQKTPGGTQGTKITVTLSAGVSFTITSDNASDTSTYQFLLIERN